jgi:DNA (cytosine-5)-methyltransferase 1
MREAVGFDVYAGGFTVGVKKHFKVVCHLEEGRFGTASAAKNHPDVAIHVGRASWPLAEMRGRRIGLLYGNPPCAGWSALTRKARTDEEKGGIKKGAETFFEVASALSPDAMVWETVSNAMKVDPGFVEDRGRECAAAGYRAYAVLFNGHHCGLPQNRKRLFFVASKFKIKFERPSGPRPTVRDAIGSVQGDPGPGYKGLQSEVALLERCPPGVGGDLRTFWIKMGGVDVKDPATGKVRGKPPFVRKRCWWDRPAGSASGSPHLYHPDLPRPLTLLEFKLVCGYPADYEFVGTEYGKYAQMAKAVLPPPAEWIAGNVARALDAAEPAEPGYEVVDFLSEKT